MEAIEDEGWIKVHRKVINSQVFQGEGLFKVWMWCLLKANHKDKWVQITTGKGTSEVFVKRGQFIFGRKSAAKALKMPGRTVQYRMLKLATMRNLAIQTDTHYSTVTILNYDLYQSSHPENMAGTLTPNGQATDTNKNDKNEKKSLSPNKKGDPRVKEFFDYWKEIFLQQTGQPYVFSYGKEGKLIKNLLQVHDLPVLQNAAKAFYRDEQCRRRGLTIGIFFQEINRLLASRVIDPLEQARREMRERQAARDTQRNQRGGEMGDSVEKRTPKTFNNPIEEVKAVLAGGTD